jgi:N-acetylneuraminic acid mutarotase
MTTVNAPAGRYGHTALSIDNKMLVWGGYFHLDNFLNDGHWYDPALDGWTPISTVDAPIGRLRHAAVWTGQEMIVWGGESGGGGVTTNSGGRYNPSTDSWSSTSLVNAPSARQMHSAVWTGTEMIVWGGCSTVSCSQIFSDGGRYNPATDTWTPISGTGLTARRLHQAVWTGDKMIVWGGSSDPQGMAYDPGSNNWAAISTVNAPAPTYNVGPSIWTGTEMIVWGGCTSVSTAGCGSSYVNTGGRYNPATDTWTPITTTDAPAARWANSAVWTGTRLIIWGGCGASCYNTGGQFNPVTNSWAPLVTTNAPAARSHHVTVWAGSSMLVWSGCGSHICGNVTYFNTGGRYQLITSFTSFIYLPIITKSPLISPL